MTDGLDVALNAHLISDRAGFRKAGVHRYIHNLVRDLTALTDGLRITVLAGAAAVVPADESMVVRSSWPTDRVPFRVMWEQLAQPRELRRLGVALAHGPVYVGPMASPCPLVITIHDLSFIRHPDLLRPYSRVYLTVFTRLSARRAARIIAVSKHAAQETCSLLGVPATKVDVVYHGVDPAFCPVSPNLVQAFRVERGLPDRFVLYLGTLEPRKNLPRLVEAFGHVAGPEWALVLAGGIGWGTPRLHEAIEDLGLRHRAVFLGYVQDSELPLLYNAASVFAYPSLYEGFGMPVLEAQACGTPVLTSNSSSLPEAAGDAAVLVDTTDVKEIADGLSSLLHEPALRQELRARGLVHAKQFDWAQTARQTADVYRRAVGRGGSK